jgi:Spy/CpxP family protein refolding chaperone
LRPIKALSEQEISDYLAGKGMGLAKAAELNGYPGPVHVLENSRALRLTSEQEANTRTLFNQMQQKAVGLGKQLIEKERGLDELFTSKTITLEKLSAALASIGQLQARIRQTHLETHLAQTSILNPEQIVLYNRLRGYAEDKPDGGHQHGNEHR